MPDPDPWSRERREFEEREAVAFEAAEARWEQIRDDVELLSEAAFRPARRSQVGRVRQTISLTMDRELLTVLDGRVENRSRFVEAAVRAALSFEERPSALVDVVRQVALGRPVDPAVARAALDG